MKYDVSLDMTLTIQVEEGASDEIIIDAFVKKLFELMNAGEVDDTYFTIEESEEN